MSTERIRAAKQKEEQARKVHIHIVRKYIHATSLVCYSFFYSCLLNLNLSLCSQHAVFMASISILVMLLNGVYTMIHGDISLVSFL